MDNQKYLHHISTSGHAIADAARQSLDAPVLACSPWCVADLLWHVGEVHLFWESIAASGSSDPTSVVRANRPIDTDMIRWYEAGVDALVDTLSRLDPDQPVWTWSGPQTVSWIIRRMAHETAIHAWDAQWAVGMRPQIDPALASDGIDEFVYVMTPHFREGQPIVGGSVHIHCTDVEGEWLLTPGDGLELIATREHAKGSVALRGSAEDLLLVLWRRSPRDVVEVIGNEAVADRFLLRSDLD